MALIARSVEHLYGYLSSSGMVVCFSSSILLLLMIAFIVMVAIYFRSVHFHILRLSFSLCVSCFVMHAQLCFILFIMVGYT